MFPRAFAKTLTSHSPYSTKWDYILDSSLLQMVCVGMELWMSFYSSSKAVLKLAHVLYASRSAEVTSTRS